MNDNTDKSNGQLQQHLRAKAKVQLTHAESTKTPSLTVDELLYELSAYQTELEMQNEELRQVSVVLETSPADYMELYDFAPVSLLILTPEGMISEINFTGAKLLRGERKKIIQQCFVQFIADDYKNHWYRYYQLVRQQGCESQCELLLRRADETSLFVQIDFLGMKADDTDQALCIALTDISKRRQSDGLRVCALALKTISQGVLISSPDGSILFANDAFTAITGYSRAEIMGKTCRFLQGALTDPRTVTSIFLAKENGTEFSSEILNYRKDGTTFWNDLMISPVHDEDGQLTHFISITRDITERKQAEEAQRIATVAFETLDGIMVTDTNKVILRVNKAFSCIFGYSAEEVLGKTPDFLRSGRHDEDFYLALWASVVREGYWQGELWEKRKNGEVFPLWLNITAVVDANGAISHYVGSFSDITIKKQAEKILRYARQRLESKVTTTKQELEKIKEESVETSTALNVLLKHRETDKTNAQLALSYELESTILPFIKKLKGASAGRRQTIRLLDILESNLQQLLKSYGNVGKLPAVYQKLTPIETQVASMVRQGLSTKTIAATLNSSPETVSVHRKRIRKKLGLDTKAGNLYSYLLSLTE